ncbi:ferredoxin--NADP reductase [Halovivax gelatinilyticus]|uniref:ferredoxin--NADP reductase n=1 Tax=Halovivax gelatinilyticus TaxID=2961597 RepID=UPI0020CA2917|nr:FAD-dependent oxidoreductase [Halovivax gelatinilyticus]
MNRTSVTVADVRDVGPETIALELETPDAFDALPGQFVLLRASPDDEEIARHYTLSSPSVDERFEVTVGVDPDGDLSPWLASREPGDTVDVEGPFGEITYEGDQDVVAIAGGPGIGPAVAIAEAALEAGHTANVIYQDADVAHENRLDSLEAAGVPVTVLDDGDEEGLHAAIDDAVDHGQIYAFGFAAFVQTVADAIESAGGNADEALIENFG